MTADPAPDVPVRLPRTWFDPDHVETPAEDLASSLTHVLGAAGSVAAMAVMVTLAAMRGGVLVVACTAVFGAALVFTYVASAGYHACRDARRRRRMRVLDHASIYLLIAGTYTPFLLVNLGGAWGWSLFGTVWAIAAAGLVLKLFFTGRLEFLSIALYIGMGWIGIVGIVPLLAALPPGAFGFMLSGGLFYTAGVLFYAWDAMPFNHAVWHLFVMAGSAIHVAAVLLFVVPG